jgi:PhzF family phenazine biosynthesis protein
VEERTVARRFQQVDVFGTGPCSGNPVAVVLDGEGLTTEEMQRFTRWTNLSEATFVLPPTTPDADYRVRIFTLAHELPFAGHPTLGTCHAWLTAGGRPRDPDRIVQECGAGLVPIRRSDAGLAFAAPPLIRSGVPDDADLDRAVAVLGIDRDQVLDAAWVDNGPGWLGVLLADAEQVLAVEADLGRDPGQGPLDVGVVGMHPPGAPFAYEVRALFGDGTSMLREDPVTGSLNASVAQWLLDTGRVSAPYLARQGTRLGRDGRVQVQQDADGTVWVGGATATVVSGEVALGK